MDAKYAINLALSQNEWVVLNHEEHEGFEGSLKRY